MSFRRNSDRATQWRKWREGNAHALLACGLPQWLLEDESRWLRFLQEGGWDVETRYDVGMLTQGQATALRELLRREYPDGYSLNTCYLELERVIGGKG